MNTTAWLILLVSGLTALGITAFQFFKSPKLALLSLFLGLMLPVFGPILCLVLRFPFRRGRHQMAIEETIRGYRIEATEYIDKERLRNVVPVQDALNLNGESERRAFLLGLLRQKEAAGLTDTLKKALANEDPEVSHYAASAIMELQRDQYSEMMDREKEYKSQEKPSYAQSIGYAVAILNYLDSSEVGQLENYSFRSRYEKVMQYILTEKAAESSPVDFENMVEMLLRQGRYTEATDYGERYGTRYPEMEGSFLCRLRIAYHQRDLEKFSKVLEELKASPIQLSGTGLNLIRFWGKGQKS